MATNESPVPPSRETPEEVCQCDPETRRMSIYTGLCRECNKPMNGMIYNCCPTCDQRIPAAPHAAEELQATMRQILAAAIRSALERQADERDAAWCASLEKMGYAERFCLQVRDRVRAAAGRDAEKEV